MLKLTRVTSYIIVLLLVSCNTNVKKTDIHGKWKISEIAPEEGWEILHIDKLTLNFETDSLVLVHGGTKSVFDYHIVDNTLMLNETMPYGTIISVESNSMTMKLNKSKYTYIFEKIN